MKNKHKIPSIIGGAIVAVMLMLIPIQFARAQLITCVIDDGAEMIATFLPPQTINYILDGNVAFSYGRGGGPPGLVRLTAGPGHMIWNQGPVNPNGNCVAAEASGAYVPFIQFLAQPDTVQIYTHCIKNMGTGDLIELQNVGYDLGVATPRYMQFDVAANANYCVIPTVAPPANIIGWWAGDTDATDFVGTNPGTPVNGAGFVDGIVDDTFTFDGINQYVQIPNDPALDFGLGDFTIDAWVKTSFIGGTGDDYIVTKMADGTGSYYAFGYDASGTGIAFFETSDGVLAPKRLVGTTNIADGNWHHIAVARSGITTAIYVDGVNEGSTFFGPVRDTSNSNDLTIGGRVNPAGDPYFNGLIDEVEIFNRFLGLGEIQAIYNKGPIGKTKPDLIPPTITVIQPNGFEDLLADSVYQIQWLANDNIGVTAIDLELSTDGVNFNPIPGATGIANTGIFAWTVPNQPSNTVLLRATAYDAYPNQSSDISDNTFTISAGRRYSGSAAISDVLETLDFEANLDEPAYLIQGVDLEASTAINSLYFRSITDPTLEIVGQEPLSARLDYLLDLLSNLISQIVNYLTAYQIDPDPIPLHEAAEEISGIDVYFVPPAAGEYLFEVDATHSSGAGNTGSFTVTVLGDERRDPEGLKPSAVGCEAYDEANEYWSRLYYIETGEKELDGILSEVQYQVKSDIPPVCLELKAKGEVPLPVIESKVVDEGVDQYYERVEEIMEEVLEPEDEEIVETVLTEEIRNIIQKFYEIFRVYEDELKLHYARQIETVYDAGYYDFPSQLRYSSYGFEGVQLINEIKGIFSGYISNELLGSYFNLYRQHAIIATLRTRDDKLGVFHLISPKLVYSEDELMHGPEIMKSELFELIDENLRLSGIFDEEDPLAELGLVEDFQDLSGPIGRDDAFTLYYRLQQLNYFLRAEYDGQSSAKDFGTQLLDKYGSLYNIRRLLDARTNDLIAEYWDNWHGFLDRSDHPFPQVNQFIFSSRDPGEILGNLKNLLD